jgi:ABC-2 type transport system permease protein
MIKNVAIVFVHEMRILARDRQAIGLLFIMPLALIIFLTMAMQDVYQAKIGRAVKLSVVSLGACEAPDEICAQLVSELRRFYKDIQVVPDAATKVGRKSELELVLPKDIDNTIEKLKHGEKLSEVERIQLLFDPTLDQSMRAVVQGHVLLSLQTVLINKVQLELKHMDGAPKDLVPNVSRFDGLISEKAAGGVLLPNPIQQTVPAWSLFGMFFIVIPLSNSMIRDRKSGIFRRLLSFPISRGSLLLGKVLPFLVINFCQFCLMFAIGAVLLPRLTGIPQAIDFNLMSLAVVALVCSIAATGYGLMVACLTKTPEQASAFGALSVVILAVVGGVMIPRFVMPEFMQTLSMISPFYWGLEAFQDVILRKRELAFAFPKILVLLIFSTVCSAIAAIRFRWSEI